MTTLLHGENQTSLRSRLSELKNSFTGDTITVDGKNSTPQNLVQSLQPASLFTDDKKLVIVENLSGNKSLLELLSTTSDLPQIILTEEKELTKPQVTALEKIFPSLTVQEFKIDQIVFKFLDALKPGAQKSFIPLWQHYKQSEASEVILVMLARQFRLLLLSQAPDSNEVPDWARLSDWQKQKIRNQATSFQPERLKQLFSDLALLDFNSKTGQLPSSLSDSLELFLLTL